MPGVEGAQPALHAAGAPPFLNECNYSSELNNFHCESSACPASCVALPSHPDPLSCLSRPGRQPEPT